MKKIVLGFTFSFVISFFAPFTAFSQCDMTCYSDIDFAIDQGCTFTFTLADIKELIIQSTEGDCLDDGYVIYLFEDDGSNTGAQLASPTITCDHIGTVVKYIVLHVYTGDSCRGKIFVEQEEACTLSCKPEFIVAIDSVACDYTFDDSEIESLFLTESCPNGELRLQIYDNAGDLIAGNARPENALNCSDIDQLLVYEINDTKTGNSCIGTLLVEGAAEVICEISCKEIPAVVTLPDNCERTIKDDEIRSLFLIETCPDNELQLALYASLEDAQNDRPIPNNTLSCAHLDAELYYRVSDLDTGNSCAGLVDLRAPNVEINCVMVCENQVNLGINTMCEVSVEDMNFEYTFLETAPCPNGYYTLRIYADETDIADNKPLDKTLFTAEDMNTVFYYQVKEMISGMACTGMLTFSNPGILFSCPRDITITCNDDLKDPAVTGTIVNPDEGQTAGPLDGHIFWGCEPIHIDYFDIDNTASGYFTRQYTLTDAAGSTKSCEQTIFIEGELNQTLVESDITWPQDVNITCNDMTSDFGTPSINGLACSMTEINYEDQLLDINEFDYWILREWTVIDYAQYDPDASTNEGIWTHTQFIKSEDSNGPIVNCRSNFTISLDTEGLAVIDKNELLTSEIIDDCTTVADVVITKNSGATATIQDEQIIFDCTDIGQAVQIVYSATDALGNESTCATFITVNAAAPELDQIQGLSLSCEDDYTQIAGLNNNNQGFPLFYVLKDNPPLNTYNEDDETEFQGYYEGATAACSARIYVYDDASNLSNCGMGVLLRKYTIIDDAGNQREQTQAIEIDSDAIFDGNSIAWPEHITVQCGNLAADTGEPSFADGPCTNVTVEYTDNVLNFPSIQLVYRRWVISDQCSNDPNNNGVWTHQQQIIYVETGGLSFPQQTALNCEDDYTKLPNLSDDDSGVPVYYVVEDNAPIDVFGAEDMINFQGYHNDNNGTCGAMSIYVKDDLTGLNQCGLGTFTRNFHILDEDGSISTQDQFILVINNDIFNVSDITWPADVTISCDGESVDTGEPIIAENTCSSIQVDVSETVETVGNTTITYRLWEVRDWCQYNQSTGINNGYWTHEQQIIHVEGIDLNFPDELSISCAADYSEIPYITNNDNGIPAYYVIKDNPPLNVYDDKDELELKGYYNNPNGSCAAAIYVKDDASELNECGLGTVVRTFAIADFNNTINNEYQFITINSANPFGVDNIVWPQNTTIPCGAIGVDTGMPSIINEGCSNITSTFIDEEEILSELTIIYRNWQVIDECIYDPALGIDGPGIWTDTQIITREQDILPPTILCAGNLIIDIEIGAATSVSAADLDGGTFDDCSGVDYFEIKRLDQGNSDYSNSVTFDCDDMDKFPITVEIIAYDEAGNSSTCTSNIISVSVLGNFVQEALITDLDCSGNTTGAIGLLLADDTQNYTFEWTGPNGYTSTTRTIVNLAAGTYDLAININGACTQYYSYEVGGSNDCVWPGDANNDGNANHFDLLNIGMSFDSTGTARINPSNDWIGQYAEDWDYTFADGVNYKFADADGDGSITSNDVSVLNANWGLTHDFTAPPSSRSNARTYAEIPFFVQEQTVQPNSFVALPVILGTNAQVADQVYGIAFSIYYDTKMIQAENVVANFEKSWLGEETENLLMVQRNFKEAGRIDIAISRTDGINISGAGTICELEITIADMAHNSEIESSKELIFTLEHTRLINVIGDEMPVSPLLSTSIVDETTSATIANHDNNISLFPNPANAFVNIQSANEIIEKVELFNINGQLIETIIAKDKNLKIASNHLDAGMYIFKIHSANKVSVENVILQR